MTNQELIKKWKEVLDYTDKDTPELSEFKRLYLAILMNNTENCYKQNNENIEILKIIIPQMRRNGGPLEKVEINNKLWDIINIKNIEGQWKKYAVDTDILKTDRGNHPAYMEWYLGNCWEFKNGKWIWNSLP